MPDREKVIDRLQKVSRYFKSMMMVGYDGDSDIYREHRESVKMAIALLKEQEAVKVQYTAMGGLRYGACPQCDARIDNLVNPKACGFCGQELKWE